MDLETNMVIVSRDVVFDEISSYRDDADNSKNTTTDALFPDDSTLGRKEFPIVTDIPAEENREATTNIEVATRKNPQRQKKLPGHLSDFVVDINQFSVLSCFFMGGTSENESRLYSEAKEILEWENAMMEEISALQKNDTWELVPKPHDVDLITCKWVYKMKKKTDGRIDRHKARLVARGFSQQYGRDCDETFSPVARMVTLQTISL